MTLDELKAGLEEAGADYEELVATSPAADKVTFITVHRPVSMADEDDRLYFGDEDPNVTSHFVFDAEGKLAASRSAFNLGLVLDTAALKR